MGVPPELIDGERFVRAWKRFRERFPEDELSEDHRSMLQQYLQTAVFYHDKALHLHGRGVEDDFIATLNGISAEAATLIEAKCASEHKSHYRIPRASDILKTRRELAAATVAVAAVPIEPPRTRAQSNETVDSPTDVDPIEEDEETKPATMDFSYDDLKSMMETKEVADKNLSTQEIRRRLGLMNRENVNQTSSSESMAQEEQELIKADMVNLAKALKDSTTQINQTLVDDVKILDAVGQSAESNADRLARENEVLKRHEANSIGLWTSLYLVMGAVMVFMATYIYMKLFSRRLY